MAVPRIVQPLNVAFPGQNAELSAQPNTQPISPWWQFWRNLWLRTGGDTGVDSTLLQSNVSNLETLGLLAPKPTSLPPLPTPITPGASPFSYQAPAGGYVLIAGGTVSAVAMTRDGGVTSFAFPHAGPVPVATGDVVVVTYSGVPTMTMVNL